MNNTKKVTHNLEEPMRKIEALLKDYILADQITIIAQYQTFLIHTMILNMKEKNKI